MDEERMDNAKRFAKIWWQSRYDAHATQEQVAFGLGVSRRTVQNWEKGISSPSLFESTEWFRVLGLNPMPYYMSYLFPDKVDGIRGSDPDDKITAALSVLVEQLPITAKRQLLYILFGNHGSSPTAVLNLVNAHLQTPMRDRINHATLIMQDYELDSKLGNLVREENIKPDVKLLEDSINTAKAAILKNQTGYVRPDA